MPSDNVHSRSEELVNVERWAQANNLTLNRAKFQEIVFTYKRRQPRFQEFLTNISRVDVITILGVTVTNTLSVRKHWTCQLCHLFMFTKCPRPANTQHPQHDSCFSPHHLQGCFSKTFIDIVFFSLLFYVFTFLFNMYRLLFTVISSRLTSCN